MFYNQQLDERENKTQSHSPNLERENKRKITVNNLPTFEFEFREDLEPESIQVQRPSHVRLPFGEARSMRSSVISNSGAMSPTTLGSRLNHLEKLETLTKYFIVSPYQLTFLRRGFKQFFWLASLGIAIGLFTFFNLYETHAVAPQLDKQWLVMAMGLFIAFLSLIWILFFIQVPYSNRNTNVPAKMAYLLQRLLFATVVIFLIHFKNGISIDKQLTYQEYVDGNGSEILRAFRIFLLIALVPFLIYLLYALICLWHINGFDGTRVSQTTELAMYKSIPFGSLVFQQGLDCGICLQRFRNNQRVVQLKCSESHIFHRHCMNEWVEYDKHRCPYCQRKIK